MATRGKYVRSKEHREAMSKLLSGNKNPNWRGGITKTMDGYVLIYSPSHPFCNNNGYVRQHRLIMEGHIGRYLRSAEEVHHINGIITDNRIENLFLCSDSREHKKIDHPFRGKRLSEDHRLKLSKSHQTQIPWNRGLNKKAR